MNIETIRAVSNGMANNDTYGKLIKQLADRLSLSRAAVLDCVLDHLHERGLLDGTRAMADMARDSELRPWLVHAAIEWDGFSRVRVVRIRLHYGLDASETAQHEAKPNRPSTGGQP